MRILIADDHAVVRRALARALQSEPQIEMVGEASDGRSAVQQVGALKPDIVLMDVMMPGSDGVEATRWIAQQYPATKVIAMSVHCLGPFARRMLEAGASAYVLKDGDINEVLEAIDVIGMGRTYVSAEVTGLGRGSSGPAHRGLLHVG